MLTTSLPQANINLVISTRDRFRNILYAFGNELNGIAHKIGNQLFWSGEEPTRLEVDLVKRGGALSHESALYAEHQILELIQQLGQYALHVSSLTKTERLHHFNACCSLYKPYKKSDSSASERQETSKRATLNTPVLSGPKDTLANKQQRRYRK